MTYEGRYKHSYTSRYWRWKYKSTPHLRYKRRHHSPYKYRKVLPLHEKMLRYLTCPATARVIDLLMRLRLIGSVDGWAPMSHTLVVLIRMAPGTVTNVTYLRTPCLKKGTVKITNLDCLRTRTQVSCQLPFMPKVPRLSSHQPRASRLQSSVPYNEATESLLRRLSNAVV